jgi:Flp pilus assembly protein TadD
MRTHENVTENEPPEMISLTRAGLVLLEDGHCREAVAVLNEAAARQPTDGFTWFALGRAYFDIKRWTDARAALCLAQINDGPEREIAQYLSKIAIESQLPAFWVSSSQEKGSA